MDGFGFYEKEKVKKSAVLSDCGNYRYELTRIWDIDYRTLTFIGLNPSRADASKDDNTIRKCMGFATRMGFGGIRMLNLYAYRSPYPGDLLRVEDPVGPDNDHYLTRDNTETVMVAAWGAFGPAEERADRVEELINRDLDLYCLGKTAGGFPRHPLYVPYSQELEIYSQRDG